MACSTGSPGESATAGDAGAALDASTDVVYERPPYDGVSLPQVARVPVRAQVVSSRVDTQSLLFAAGEMQISGEPFASGFAGRNLGDYDRNYIPPNMYILNLGTSDPIPEVDPFGFGTAVESYEYSKYYMNNVIEESTAGVSLANGPVVAQLPGATSLDRLRARMQDLLSNAGTDVGGYAVLPAPQGNPLNYLGFPGQWPSFLPFKDWDPTLVPSMGVVSSCTYQGGYSGLGVAGSTSIDPVYECNYNSTQLPNRDQQVDKVLVPGVIGLAAWKEALWAIDFAGRVHDSCNNQVNIIAAADLPLVGVHGNTVQAQDYGACVGTYIGSSSLEGMWGLTMMAAMDNAAEWLIDNPLTSDGQTLGGFPSKLAAMQYDYTSPLQWFPASVNVTEDETVVPYPAVAQLAIADATSRSVDLAALLLGHSMFFGTSDPRNVGVGQRVGFQCVFDGDPFPPDDGIADGENTVHDRSLSVIRVAFVDLDRMHSDPSLGIIMDSSSVSGGVATPSSTVTTTNLAHVLIALRQTVLSLNGSITQYGAPDPSPLADLQGILNPLPFHPPATLDGGTPDFSQRVRQVFLTNAAFVRDVLTQADGSVANSATIAGGQVTLSTDATLMETQTAAARALTEAYLMTGDTTYLARARAVITRLDSDFYSPPARMYRQQALGPDQIDMSSERFGWLESALRETYKSLYVPGDPVLDRTVLQDRIERVIKLYLNGWDDLNGDQVIDAPQECLQGRMQLGEQALTGELGKDGLGRAVADRDGDCVIEIAHGKFASVQASDVLFQTVTDAGQ
jgi:hypothetical protein